MPALPPRDKSRPRWTSAHFSLAALALNGAALLALFANLLSGNAAWQVAVGAAIVLLALGGGAAWRARILRLRERRG
ncbi:hypothetical protein [Herbiconiux sp.]|jgi:hypothetical protein|uniref:hypothetical protein n=1 Tax=Herbiconiux sp. TaxID=1871186 RepID=UPI0025C5E813|nr:hypothetical protein [Herbiconiux sp.]